MGSLGPRWQGGVRSLRIWSAVLQFAFGLWLDGKDWSYRGGERCASKGEPAGSRRN